jgi:hypothetical protein
MKYWSYNEMDVNPDGSIGYVVTLSEDQIIAQYWSYWYNQMCNKLGTEYVNNNYTTHDCIDDWVVANWAWEQKNEN